MARLDLTAERVRELLDYDPSTGIFTNRVSRGRLGKGKVAGSIKHAIGGYVVIAIDGHEYRAHWLAWLLTTGAWPKNEIDHIDGNPNNNRIANLRDVTSAINKQNRHIGRRSGTKTGIIGVSIHKRTGLFRAYLSVGGRCVFYGEFRTIDEAVAARASAAERFHPFRPR